MFGELWKSRAQALFALCWALCPLAHSQSLLLDEVHTIAGNDHAVPVEHSFPVSNDGTYQVTLTDGGAPTAPLANVSLAVTSGSVLVSTPLTAPGSLTFTGTRGTTYTIHVVGKPGPVLGSGPIGISVTNTADQSVVASYSDLLALPGVTQPSNQATIDDSFQVTAAGNYQVTLTDLAPALGLSQNLTGLTLAILQEGGGLITNPPLSAAGSTNVSLQPGNTYRILAAGLADATVAAGLFSAVVTPAGGGAPVYTRVVPVGRVVLLGSKTLAAGGYTLRLADLSLPAALSQVSAAAINTLTGQADAHLTAGGTQDFTATPNMYAVFGVGTPATATQGGSFTASLLPQGGAPVLDVARAMSSPDGTVVAYNFDVALTSAGSYSMDLADFNFPASFTALSAAAVQSGGVLGSPLTQPGSINVTATAGSASLLVFAHGGTGGSLFGLDLTAQGSTSPVFTVTQGVSQAFSSRQIPITSAGTYQVTVADLGFPAPFANLGIVVTQGTTRVVSIFGGASFKFDATPGNYFINFIAQPSGSDNAGTYAVTVAPAPPSVPQVSLTADVTSVTEGGAVNLTWTSSNATSCTASGGWSGAQVLNGTTKITNVTANTTYTLTCSGAGGSTPASVSVTVTPKSGGGGGGGAVSLDLLLLLAGGLACHLMSVRAQRHHVTSPSRSLHTMQGPPGA
jgi:hypothetical protein